MWCLNRLYLLHDFEDEIPIVLDWALSGGDPIEPFKSPYDQFLSHLWNRQWRPEGVRQSLSLSDESWMLSILLYALFDRDWNYPTLQISDSFQIHNLRPVNSPFQPERPPEAFVTPPMLFSMSVKSMHDQHILIHTDRIQKLFLEHIEEHGQFSIMRALCEACDRSRNFW